jgi:hypothetical protein
MIRKSRAAGGPLYLVFYKKRNSLSEDSNSNIQVAEIVPITRAPKAAGFWV